jgi:hypothetical protein
MHNSMENGGKKSQNNEELCDPTKIGVRQPVFWTDRLILGPAIDQLSVIARTSL